MLKKTKALFLDRDGVFNAVIERDGSVHSPRSWDEIRHFEGLEVLKAIKEKGYLLLMVTNQPDIERGIVSESFVSELHTYYKTKYALDKIYVCPHASNTHPDKKPNPGLFLKAVKDFNIDINASFHLGDTERDTKGAKNAGCKSILITRSYNTQTQTDLRIHSYSELLQIL